MRWAHPILKGLSRSLVGSWVAFWQSKIALENGHVSWATHLHRVIFNDQVESLEGTSSLQPWLESKLQHGTDPTDPGV